jgi:hypothetical protein
MLICQICSNFLASISLHNASNWSLRIKVCSSLVLFCSFFTFSCCQFVAQFCNELNVKRKEFLYREVTRNAATNKSPQKAIYHESEILKGRSKENKWSGLILPFSAIYTFTESQYSNKRP